MNKHHQYEHKQVYHNDTQLLRVQEFESMMANFMGTSKFGDRRYKVLDEKIGLILKLIEEELKK